MATANPSPSVESLFVIERVSPTGEVFEQETMLESEARAWVDGYNNGRAPAGWSARLRPFESSVGESIAKAADKPKDEKFYAVVCLKSDGTRKRISACMPIETASAFVRAYSPSAVLRGEEVRLERVYPVPATDLGLPAETITAADLGLPLDVPDDDDDLTAQQRKFIEHDALAGVPNEVYGVWAARDRDDLNTSDAWRLDDVHPTKGYAMASDEKTTRVKATDLRPIAFEPMESDRRYAIAAIQWGPWHPDETETDESRREWRRQCRTFPQPKSWLDLPSEGIALSCREPEAGMNLTLPEAIEQAVDLNREHGLEDGNHGDWQWFVVVELGRPLFAKGLSCEMTRCGMGVSGSIVHFPLRVYRPTPEQLADHAIEAREFDWLDEWLRKTEAKAEAAANDSAEATPVSA